MNALNSYKIDLKNMRSDVSEYQFCLDNAFFEAIDDVLIRKGLVDVNLRVRKTAGAFELTFCMKGSVQIPCDRCLEDMEQTIDSVSTLKVKLGDEYEDDGELITVPYEDGVLDVSWTLYEFIALEIPIKHVHEPGKCNVAMIGVLKQHEAADSDDDTEAANAQGVSGMKPVDPRWNELKKILDNN